MTPVAVKSLLAICVVLSVASDGRSASAEQTAAAPISASAMSVKRQTDAEAAQPQRQQPAAVEKEALPAATAAQEAESGARRIVGGYEVDDEYASQDHHAAFRKRAKPLKNIFMGIYKNYKSTYLGNKTATEYRQRLRERNGAAEQQQQQAWAQEDVEVDGEEGEVMDDDEEMAAHVEPEPTTQPAATAVEEEEAAITTTAKAEQQESVATKPAVDASADKKRRKRKQKPPAADKPQKRAKTKAAAPAASSNDRLLDVPRDKYRYNVGPGVNLSLDLSNDVVQVKLDGSNLQEILAGHWLSDNTEQGRGKKYDMMTKVLPLFILPFLIQSAIVPFLVTKLKLLLMKSILVGKLAIFLLIVSALKNNTSKMQSYEAAPSYWASEPSRRSELPAAASPSSYGGYRVEGKPAWIN